MNYFEAHGQEDPATAGPDLVIDDSTGTPVLRSTAARALIEQEVRSMFNINPGTAPSFSRFRGYDPPRESGQSFGQGPGTQRLEEIDARKTRGAPQDTSGRNLPQHRPVPQSTPPPPPKPKDE
jgi:hypothetical protein